jgi:uncharacterized protein with NRDE domain
MCLLLLWSSAHADFDLLLAGNRDEFYRRPALPPAILHRDPLILAGKDLEAGGTWMGRNQHGLAAAITNRYGSRLDPPPNPRSRGEIVLEVLKRPDAQSAAEWVSALPVERYRGFNLLFGDRQGFYFFGSAEGVPPRQLAPGFHALSNSTLDDLSWPKVARAHRFAEAHRRMPGEQLIAELQDFLCDRTPPDRLPAADRNEEIHGALGAVFIETPEYGTVSASIITLGGKLGDRYYFAEGKDMRAPRNPVSASPFRAVAFHP